jgi:hypothetical protein
MVYFTVYISHNEIVNLQRHLGSDTYCLLRPDPAAECFHGIVVEAYYHTLLHALSAETLERLEYMNESEFRQVVSDPGTWQAIGNRELIDRA